MRVHSFKPADTGCTRQSQTQKQHSNPNLFTYRFIIIPLTNLSKHDHWTVIELSTCNQFDIIHAGSDPTSLVIHPVPTCTPYADFLKLVTTVCTYWPTYESVCAGPSSIIPYSN